MNEAMNSICASIWFHFSVMAPISANCSVVYAFFGSDSNRAGLRLRSSGMRRFMISCPLGRFFADLFLGRLPIRP
jgi:hypothetical protein